MARTGRPPGSKNRRTQELVAAATRDGITPLEYMLRVMRDETVEDARRDDMAKAAASFVHPKLAAIEHKGDAARPLQVVVVRFADLPGDEADDPKLIEHDAI